MVKYDNFIFDLYGTLMDIKTNERKVSLWRKCADILCNMGFTYDAKSLRKDYVRFVEEETVSLIRALGVESPKAMLHKEYNGAVTLSCDKIMIDGEVRKPEIELRKVFRKLMSPWITDEQVDLFAIVFRTLSRESCFVYNEIFDIFDAIHKNGKKIFLLTNAQNCFTIPELRAAGLLDLFDDVFISSDFECAKPDPRFIRALIKKHDLDISKSLMVGNDYRSDIAIANAVGMDSLYIRTSDSPSVTDTSVINATYTELQDGELKLKHFERFL